MILSLRRQFKKNWHGENNNLFCFSNKLASRALVTSDAWLLLEVCVVVCISISVSTKDVWNEVQAQTRQLCPCHDVFIHAEAGWHHASTQKEKTQGGGGLFYILHLKPSVDLCRQSQFHTSSSPAPVLLQAFKIWAAWQHSGACFGGQSSIKLFKIKHPFILFFTNLGLYCSCLIQ